MPLLWSVRLGRANLGVGGRELGGFRLRVGLLRLVLCEGPLMRAAFSRTFSCMANSKSVTLNVMYLCQKGYILPPVLISVQV